MKFHKIYIGVTVFISFVSIVELILRSFDGLQTTIGNTTFDAIELATIIYFSIEFLLRFLLCHNKIEFIKSPINIIDILSTLSYFIYLPLNQFHELGKIKNIGRIFRSMIIFKSLRFVTSFKLIGRVLVKGYKEISVFLTYVLISVLIMSNITYEIENESNPGFDSIPSACWWTIITITTVFIYCLNKFILCLNGLC